MVQVSDVSLFRREKKSPKEDSNHVLRMGMFLLILMIVVGQLLDTGQGEQSTQVNCYGECE